MGGVQKGENAECLRRTRGKEGVRVNGCDV